MEWAARESGLTAADGTMGLRSTVAVGAASIGCGAGVYALVASTRLALTAV